MRRARYPTLAVLAGFALAAHTVDATPAAPPSAPPHESTERTEVDAPEERKPPPIEESWPPPALDYQAIPASAPQAPGNAWYERLRVSAFVETSARLEAGSPLVKPQDTRQNPLLPLRGTRGITVGQLGIDGSLHPDPLGGTISLRLGPVARAYAGRDLGTGLEYVKQGYATLSGGLPVRIDIGKFDAPFSSESGDSYQNLMHTESPVYALALPRFLTGILLSHDLWLLPDFVTVRALLSNGWNTSIDNNVGKTYGAQLEIHVEKPHVDEYWWVVRAGYLTGPELDDHVTVTCPADTRFASGACVASPGAAAERVQIDRGDSNHFRAFRHLFTASMDLLPDRERRFHLLAQFGYVWDKQRSTPTSSDFEVKRWLSGSVGLSFELSRRARFALRADYFSDRNGGSPLARKTHVFSNTASFDWMPLHVGPERMNLIPKRPLLIRTELRSDWATEPIFPKDVRSSGQYSLSGVVAIIAHTD